MSVFEGRGSILKGIKSSVSFIVIHFKKIYIVIIYLDLVHFSVVDPLLTL